MNTTRWVFALTLALFLPSVGHVRADPILTLLADPVVPGTTGTLYVRIALPPSDPGPVVFAGYALDLEVSPGSGVEFTAIDFLEPYAFGGNSAQRQLLPPDNVVGSVTQFTASGNDIYFDLMNPFDLGVTLFPGDVLGLFRVQFSVASGTPPGSVSFTVAPTSQFALGSSVITVSPTSGTLQVIPEPGTGLLFLIGGGLGVFLRRKRR